MAELTTLVGLSTEEIALMPDASVRGFSDDVNLFHASHPDPKLLLTTAFASPVVMLRSKLYISAAVWMMNSSSLSSNSGDACVYLFFANSSSEQSCSTTFMSCPTFAPPALTKLRNFTDHSSNSFTSPPYTLRFL